MLRGARAPLCSLAVLLGLTAIPNSSHAYNAPQPVARLLIITSDFMLNSLEPLLTHKLQTGMPTTILTMDDVHNYFNGPDDPWNIKQTIAYFHANYGTKYVMLAGNPTQVPTRHYTVLDPSGSVLSYNFTDHYYANLYKGHTTTGSNSGVVDPWDNGTGDGRYNILYWGLGTPGTENPDNVDAYPDVVVARVPVTWPSQMTAYVNKVIAYESPTWRTSSVGAGTRGFVQDYNYSGADADASSIEKSFRDSAWSPADLHYYFPNSSVTPASPWLTQGTPALVEQAAATTSLIFYVGHGAPWGWGYNDDVQSSDIDTLTNTQQYPVVFAAGCSTAQFAPMDTYPTQLPDDWAAQPGSIGAEWLVPATNEGGAIAYIGESLVEEDNWGTSLGQTFATLTSSGVSVLGDAWHLSQVHYWQTQASTDPLGAPRIFLSDEILLGDPSLRLQVTANRRNRAAIPRVDYDGDGLSDLSYFLHGGWTVQTSSGVWGTATYTYGTTGDVPVAGDFDGDGISDVAVYRPSNGTWYIVNSSGVTGVGGFGGQTRIAFGISQDIPVSGDYDGDGITDMAIFRPSVGLWSILNSSGGTGSGGTTGETNLYFGATGDIPVLGDFDGDGISDIAVFRPSNGYWYILNSSGYTGPGGFTGQTRLAWGESGDIPVSGDFDGDGKTDIAIWRPSNVTWYILNSNGSVETTYFFGAAGDIPVSGDFDGDGHSDVALFRPSNGFWYIINSGGYNGPGGFSGQTRVQFGTSGDTPMLWR
jgi:hypothetical protein